MNEPDRHRRRMRSLLLGTAVACVGCRGCEEPPPEQRPTPREPAPSHAPPPVASGVPLEPPTLRTHVERARRANGRPYVAPSDAELDAYGAWTRAVVGAALTDALPAHAPPKGFAGRLSDGGRYWLLAEAESDKRGAGLCVLRPGGARALLVEAPHTFFDRGTLDIALLAFEELEARALLVNTMHRSGGQTKEERQSDARSGESASDVAHAESSFFSRCHVELTRADPEIVVVQLHGFKDERAPGTGVVVSASKTRGNARKVASNLRAVLANDSVRLYPDEIGDLGGTKNRQAELSRATKSAFIHLEISATVRKKLAEDAELARRFVRALDATRRGALP